MTKRGSRKLNLVSDFAEFLSNRDYSLNEILNYFARVVFSDLNILRIRMMQLNEETNSLANIGLSGARVEDLNILGASLFLGDKYPANHVFKSGQVLCINTLPDWGVDYPLMHGSPIPNMSKTYIGIPVFVTSVPFGVISIISGDILELDEEETAFFNAVSSVFSMYYYRKILSSPEEKNSFEGVGGSLNLAVTIEGSELTERQLSILRLISEDRTNTSISQFLGYSESTIRAEIIRIFAKLGCNNRRDASKIYESYKEVT